MKWSSLVLLTCLASTQGIAIGNPVSDMGAGCLGEVLRYQEATDHPVNCQENKKKLRDLFAPPRIGQLISLNTQGSLLHSLSVVQALRRATRQDLDPLARAVASAQDTERRDNPQD
ncbi:hypothetical protein [Paludibacterium purpuratum]|uniref:Uncharacterized protein n=1 Tax=Paludibacterium purpuratum TaxID=1144873 RepID=A0A4R7B9B6_9NEIS|nr:hypothetical protein [Paludibacterium purpuratum]TDR81464.1 hypothetical protein DFP86_103117 [Paludibacterium purpuratum]